MHKHLSTLLATVLWIGLLIGIPAVGLAVAVDQFTDDCRTTGGTVVTTDWHGIPDVSTCSHGTLLTGANR